MGEWMLRFKMVQFNDLCKFKLGRVMTIIINLEINFDKIMQ